MAEVVDATVITDELAPLTGLDQMVATITEQAIALAEQYRPHAIVDEQDYKDSKKARAQARKDIKALRADYAERMGIIRDAVKDADARVKVALAPLDAIDSSYKPEITAHETAWMEARIAELQAEYESYAPALVPLVPMARLIEVYGQQDGQKWLNRGTNIQLAKTLLRVAVDNIADGEQRVTDSVEPDDLEGAKADYFTSLDADSAIESARKRAERRADVRRLEQERREAEEEEARQRTEEVYAKVPKIRGIDDEITGLNRELSRIIISDTVDKKKAGARIRQEMERLNMEKAFLLTENDYELDYMDIHYTCPLCKDTGMLETGEKCQCYEKVTRDQINSLLNRPKQQN